MKKKKKPKHEKRADDGLEGREYRGAFSAGGSDAAQPHQSLTNYDLLRTTAIAATAMASTTTAASPLNSIRLETVITNRSKNDTATSITLEQQQPGRSSITRVARRSIYLHSNNLIPPTFH